MSGHRSTKSPGSTTAAGAPAPSDRKSLTIGHDGPSSFDVQFLEQMAHFNREKISVYTKAVLFQPGATTDTRGVGVT